MGHAPEMADHPGAAGQAGRRRLPQPAAARWPVAAMGTRPGDATVRQKAPRPQASGPRFGETG